MISSTAELNESQRSPARRPSSPRPSSPDRPIHLPGRRGSRAGVYSSYDFRRRRSMRLKDQQGRISSTMVWRLAFAIFMGVAATPAWADTVHPLPYDLLYVRA